MFETREGHEDSPGRADKVEHRGCEQQQSLQREAATEMEDGYPAAQELHGAPGL